MNGDICYHCDGTGDRDFLSGAPCHECGGTGWREEPDVDDECDEVCRRCGCNLQYETGGYCDSCEFEIFPDARTT